MNELRRQKVWEEREEEEDKGGDGREEHRRIDTLELSFRRVLEKTLESPLDCKEIKPVNPKGNNPDYSLEGLMLKFQYFGHLM